jgi:RNA polymerase sigma-70 factor (ECF subfamily)
MVFDESSTDEELMRAYQNGVDNAFEILYRRHSSRVYGFLVNRLKNRMQADDVFQATFLKLHQSRKHYDPSFPFSPWLFTVCKSVLLDHLRKSKRGREENNDLAIETAIAPLDSESVIIAQEMNLEALSQSQRTAIELRYKDDLPFEEIALRLQTSPSNVRQIVSRGIKSLRRLAGRKGEK